MSNRPLHFARLGFCKIGGAPLEKKANNCQVPAPEQTVIRFGLGMNDDAETCVDKKKLPCFPLKVFSNTTETIAGICKWFPINFFFVLSLPDAYRKLAKLCAKTSIVENPSKLPEEALGFVTRGERAYTRRVDSSALSSSSMSSSASTSSSSSSSSSSVPSSSSSSSSSRGFRR